MDIKEIEKAIKDGKSLDNMGRRQSKPFKIDGMDASQAKMPMPKSVKNKKFELDGEEFEVPEKPVRGKMKMLSNGGSTKDSTRTKIVEEAPSEGGFKGMVKKVLVGASRMADKIGATQEDKYKGKKPQDMEKKAKGGMVGSASKRADGCAQRGKTKGRMV